MTAKDSLYGSTQEKVLHPCSCLFKFSFFSGGNGFYSVCRPSSGLVENSQLLFASVLSLFICLETSDIAYVMVSAVLHLHT